MKILATIFFALVIASVMFGDLGVALFALFMLILLRYAEQVFKKQDEAYADDPRHATTCPDTLDILEQKGCECSESRFHGQIFDSDSKI